jgi:uncharacterized protein YyaL (SSP411 family)
MGAELIEWREWGDAAFKEAADKDRLILLDISAVWCHWCHVMDETSYSDPEVVRLLNERFVPVRVDTDRMPDVNERYNMSGWPTTAVLAPTGEVLLGATYVPPDKLRETLTGLDGFYHENRAQLGEKIAKLKAMKLQEYDDALKVTPGELTRDITAYVLSELDRNYDPVHGGFGADPKFPHPDAIDLLLTAYADTGRAGYLDMAEKSLDGMSSYGMYDQVMGGFFRYSVTRDWTVPHFEKMSDVNAGLIINCINAYRITRRLRYLDVIRGTLGYVDTWLWAEAPEMGGGGGGGGGYFCGSQDADEEYYKLTKEEREDRKPPSVDQTLYTNLNVRMSVAYLSAYELLGEARYRDRALAALGAVIARMKGEGGGLYHYYDDGPKRFGLLTDQSAAVRALLHAYQVTGEKMWLGEALSILSFMEGALWDAEHGGYFDLPNDPRAVAALAYPVKPMPENAEMSRSLGALHVLTGTRKYKEMSGKCLAQYARGYQDFSFMASGFALAVDFFLKSALELNMVGDASKPDTQALIRAAFETFVPRRVLRILDFTRDKAEIERKGYHSGDRASAYICRESTCTAKIEDPEELRKRLIGKPV